MVWHPGTLSLIVSARENEVALARISCEIQGPEIISGTSRPFANKTSCSRKSGGLARLPGYLFGHGEQIGQIFTKDVGHALGIGDEYTLGFACV